MKSFKDHYNRSRSILLLLQNGFFETPFIPIQTFSYYSNLTAFQKSEFVCIGGGNILNNSGPVHSWGFLLRIFSYPFLDLSVLVFLFLVIMTFHTNSDISICHYIVQINIAQHDFIS